MKKTHEQPEEVVKNIEKTINSKFDTLKMFIILSMLTIFGLGMCGVLGAFYEGSVFFINSLFFIALVIAFYYASSIAIKLGISICEQAQMLGRAELVAELLKKIGRK